MGPAGREGIKEEPIRKRAGFPRGPSDVADDYAAHYTTLARIRATRPPWPPWREGKEIYPAIPATLKRKEIYLALLAPLKGGMRPGGKRKHPSGFFVVLSCTRLLKLV